MLCHRQGLGRICRPSGRSLQEWRFAPSERFATRQTFSVLVWNSEVAFLLQPRAVVGTEIQLFLTSSSKFKLGILSPGERPFPEEWRHSQRQIQSSFPALVRPFRGRKDRSPGDRDSVCSRDSVPSSARMRGPGGIESAPTRLRLCGTASHRFSANREVRYAASPLSRSRTSLRTTRHFARYPSPRPFPPWRRLGRSFHP